MAVFNFESGNPLLLLREMICQVERILEQHSYLKSGIYLFQQVLQVVILSNSPKTPQENLILPPISPNFGKFGAILAVSHEMKWNAKC